MKRYDASAPLLSLHVPKCGGNSVMLLLRELFGDRLSLHYHDDRSAEAPARLLPGPGACIHGHFDNRRGQGAADYYPGVDQMITFLRDPFDMQVSCYFYTKRLAARGELFLDGAPAAVEGSLVEYLERRIDDPAVGPSVLGHLPEPLSGDTWEEFLEGSFVYVGITEDLRGSAVVLADRLGCEPRWLGHANASERDEEVPVRLREPYLRSHPRETELYQWAKKTYDDPRAYHRPIRRSRVEEDELEYRCGLCVDYVACASTGRPQTCDGGSAFRPLSRPLPGVTTAWLEAAAELEGSEDAVRSARALAAEEDLWIGPALVWRGGAAHPFELTAGWPDRAIDEEGLARLAGLLGDDGGALLERAREWLRAGVRSLLVAVGSEPRFLAPLDPRGPWPGPAVELPAAPYLAEIGADEIRVHSRARDCPTAPLLEGLGALESTSVIYELTADGAQPVAVEASLVRSRRSWSDLVQTLFDGGYDVGPFNRLEARFHLAVGAITAPISGSAHPVVLHYRALRWLNPTL